jgi:hypothetical protein
MITNNHIDIEIVVDRDEFDQISPYFDRQILDGLENIPIPDYPGSLIVTGKAQSVFTGKSPGDTILAAAKHGNLTHHHFSNF